VTYDAATINEATSVAGAVGALMVDESLLPGVVGAALRNAGLEEVEDVRGRDSLWVYNHYGSMLNKDLIVRQQPTFSHQLRDFAVLHKAMVFNEEGATRDLFLGGQNDHGLVFGWGYNNSEQEFFSSASAHNLAAVPADHQQISAAPSQWEVELPRQPHDVDVNAPTQPGKHYVAFVMSDGDNVQWLTNDYRDPRWFGSPHRGTFPMNFDLSPSLPLVNRVALKYFYDEAAGDAEATYFVTASGVGVNYPSQVPDLGGFIDATTEAMESVDHQIISVLEEAFDLDALQRMVDAPQALGLMLKIGPAYAGQRGAIHWHNGKPIVSVKYTLWDGFDTPNEIIAALNAAPADPLHDVASYSIVNVHPWSTSTAGGGQGDPMSNVDHIVQSLDSRVEVVTLEELFIHLRRNFGDPVVGLSSDFDADGDVDGDDFLAWQTGFGTLSGASREEGDADADGDVDGDDFLIWQREFGTALRGRSALVPEPASITTAGLLAALAAAIVGSRQPSTPTRATCSDAPFCPLADRFWPPS
jgi:hypothetical protein